MTQESVPRATWPERTTPLSPNPVVIATPDDTDGQSAARRIADGIAQLNSGIAVEIRQNPDPSTITKAQGPVVVIGNLADSLCARHMYGRILCATDRHYPGPGGFELRTLGDPFGTGHNVIHLGYSDTEGLQTVTDRLLDLLADPLPPLCELHATRLPFQRDQEAHLRTLTIPDVPHLAANDPDLLPHVYMAYLTGEPDLLRNVALFWERILQAGYEINENVVQVHLYSYKYVSIFRLLQVSGLIDNILADRIMEYLFRWAQSPDGHRHLAPVVFSAPDFPHQNHGLIPALTLLIMADFFEIRCGDHSAYDIWRKAGAAGFSPYGSSWKPLCDGLCHGWWMSQPILLDHAAYDPAHRYFQEGGAQKAAECALAIVNNAGWMPLAGDGCLRRSFPGPSLRATAAWLGDGRCRFAADMADDAVRLSLRTELPRAWDAAPPPEEPVDHIGLKIIDVDPLLYHAWERHPETAKAAVDTPPSGPIEKCFDKLAIRSGWGPDDDYLLIDGIGGGSHSYADAMGVNDYMRFGLSCLVAEDSLAYSAPEDHSVVTITRDGEMGTVPGFALLEAHEEDGNGNVYLRMRLEHYAGADWVREVFFQKGRCVVFHDTVVASEPGDYAVEAHFRIPASVHLDGRQLTSERHSDTVGTVTFRLTSLSPDEALRVDAVPVHLRYKDDEQKALWMRRYRTDSMELNAFRARAAKRLNPGETITLTHLAQIQGPGETLLRLETQGESLALSDSDTTWNLKPAYPATPLPSEEIGSEPATGRAAASQQSLYEAPSPIAAVRQSGNRTLLGTQSGEVILLGEDHREIWKRQAPGKVWSVALLERGGSQGPLCIAGSEPNVLIAWTEEGEEAWRLEIDRIPSPWPWWELIPPPPVALAAARVGNEDLIAAGCGDLRLRLLDASGQQRWHWRYNEGVPGQVFITDIDGDGESEIVVGGEILTDRSPCRILTPDGMLKADLPVEGWTSRSTALAWGEIDGKRYLALGANRGRNLHLYDVTRLELRVDPSDAGRYGTGEIAEDAQRRHRWEKNLGGEVTGLAILDNGTITVATSMGFLQGYDLEGCRAWSVLNDQPIAALQRAEDTLISLGADGAATWWSGEGTLLHRSEPVGHGARMASAKRDAALIWEGRRLMRVG